MSSSRVHLPLLVVGVGFACAGESPNQMPAVSTGPLGIYDAYAPASVAEDVSSLYFTVENSAAEPDTLLGVSIPSGTAHLHEVITEDGLTRMSPVRSLLVPAHGSLRLAPGGYHVMLSDMDRLLQVGDTIQIELEFARAGNIGLPVAVLTYSEVVRRLEASEHRHE